MNSGKLQYSEEEEKRRSLYIGAAVLAAVILIVVITAVGNSRADVPVVSIGSFEELQKIGKEKGYPLDGSYVLEKDLDGEGITITAIGTKDKPFAGKFDGQGHTICNAAIEVQKIREIKKKEVIKRAADKKEENQDKNQDVQQLEEANQEMPEMTSMLVSVDGYPLFEFVSDSPKGKVVNLGLEDLKIVQSDQDAEEKQKKESEKKEVTSNDGKEKNPIEIHSWEEFKNIGNTQYHSDYTLDADYVLVKAIKSDGKKFIPIGTKEHPFTGTFDGHGMKIDISANPEIKADAAYNGLFGVVETAGTKEESNGE